MRAGFVLRMIEVNLVGLYVVGLCVLYPALPFAFFYTVLVAPWLGLMRWGGLAALLAVGWLVLMLTALWQWWARGGVTSRPGAPLRDLVGNIAGLRAEVKVAARQFGTAELLSARLMLAPPLSMPPSSHLEEMVRTGEREVCLPVGCLGVWSVFELRCQLAQAMLRRRGPRWLFRRLVQQMHHLTGESSQAAAQGIENRRTRWLHLVAQRLEAELGKWQLIANLEADRKIAREYGAELVASWIRKTWQAEAALPWYKAAFLEPAAGQGLLFPLGEGYVSFHQQMEISWSEAEQEMLEAEDGLHPVLTRLEGLRHVESGSSVFDSRSAEAVFPRLREIEEEVVRRELDLPATQRFRRLAVEEYAEQVLLPLMREELARNAHLLRDKTIEDLPQLVERSRELAERYAARPVLLLDAAQKRAAIPALLGTFLLVELLNRGWKTVFTYWEGFRMSWGDVEIEPNRVVQELTEGRMTRDGFLALISAGQPQAG